MSKHLQKEIENLKKKLLGLGSRVEEAVRDSTRALEARDERLAQQIIASDEEIDQLEVEVEEECLKALALHQPVATDLRFIIAVLKINNDLERIGDLAVNIAERAVFLAGRRAPDIELDFGRMASGAREMLRKSLDALINLNPELGHEVCASDDAIDAMNRAMYVRVQDALHKNPEDIPVLIHMLSASRHLERIADHATNIAEDVIYMTEGKIVRHKAEDYLEGSS